MYHVLVVDDHELFRIGLSECLNRHTKIHTPPPAGSGLEALEIYNNEHPDVVLMDIEMPEMDGLETARALLNQSPDARILFLTGYECDPYIEEAIELGAAGYVLKRECLTELVHAIEAVASGQYYFSKSIRDRLRWHQHRPQLSRPRSDKIAALTSREQELLRHLGMGASLKEAAAAMDVSYKTADNQKANLMRKLDIHDRVELARFAICEGWVSPHGVIDMSALYRAPAAAQPIQPAPWSNGNSMSNMRQPAMMPSECTHMAQQVAN